MAQENANSFTPEQAAAVTTDLRAALGLPPQRFSTAQFVGMISDEIERLREAGKTDAEIAKLVGDAAGVEVSPEAIARHYAGPEARGRPR